MFLNKIKQKESGILLYGITPPKTQTPTEKIFEIAEKTLSRLYNLNLDALIVYDVQDESARTSEARPFPFSSALDPFEFASQYLEKLAIPKIIYRPAGKFSKDELTEWLQGLSNHNFHPVFVGLPSPDYVVKTSLKEAYEIWSIYKNDSAIGAITIPERHHALNDEDVRILDKMDCGVSYFISQCIFNVDYALKVLHDLSNTCRKQNRELPTIIFTLTVCGSAKTLHFMEWLGIHIPDTLKEELQTCENILDTSIEVCLDIADKLINHCSSNSIPFGFNIESVAIRKEEIEASINLIDKIGSMLKEKGLRKESKIPILP